MTDFLYMNYKHILDKMNLKKIDPITKFVFVIFVILVSYVVFMFILKIFFKPANYLENNMMRMMQGMSGNSYFNTLALVSMIFAAGVGVIVSYLLRPKLKLKDNIREMAFKIVRKSLSDDEKRMLDEIGKTGKITQDSLRFRLEWNKAKVSTILTNLDKMNLIQRERQGKTYKVWLSKK